MKRITIIAAMAALLLAGAGRLNAQRPVGDTIVGAEPTYMYYVYDWWRCANHDPEALQWYSHTCYFPFYVSFVSGPIQSYYIGPPWRSGLGYDAGNSIIGVQMVADHPIKVLGVAACGFAPQPSDTTYDAIVSLLRQGLLDSMFIIPNMRDTTLAGRFTDSLLLLKPIADKLEPTCLAGGPWRVENTHRYMPLPPIRTLWGEIVDSTPIVPLYEVIFDTPQVVTDSFVVAGTANNNEGHYDWTSFNDLCLDVIWLWDKRPTRYYAVFYPYDPREAGAVDIGVQGDNVLWYKYRSAPWLRLNAYSYDPFNQVPGFYYVYDPVIFPIIDPDFDTVLCDMARDVRVADSTDTTLTLMWNGGNAVQWEVVYAEVNSPTSYTVTTTAPMVTLTGLRERTNYMVRVRGMCEWDTEYGPWSDILDVWTGVHHDTPVSISNLDRFTQMMPNPARGQVTVLSSYRLSRVVVYDLSGHSVLEQEDEGLATTFDVSALAKGVYVVAIHTPAGIATKRLVVE